jgi:hypothetical protein
VNGCSHEAQTHDTRVKIVNEFSKDVKKIHPETRKIFSSKVCSLVMEIGSLCTENYWWPPWSHFRISESRDSNSCQLTNVANYFTQNKINPVI